MVLCYAITPPLAKRIVYSLALGFFSEIPQMDSNVLLLRTPLQDECEARVL